MIKSSLQLDIAKNQIRLLKLKSRLSEEDIPRERSKPKRIQQIQTQKVKNVAIKPPSQPTSARVKLTVRNQKSKKIRLSHSTSSSTKNVPKIPCYLQTLSYL